jgi:quercetin dioxygenase-like cupin family protein
VTKHIIPKPQKPIRHQKGWGHEDWISNNKEYCGKLLFFKKGKRCSFHYHIKKKETFYLASGKMEVRVGWGDDVKDSGISSYILNPGDSLEISRGLRHQMIALKDSQLFEFSTTHFETDSKRIVKGD